jgi:hypothetical protein
MFKFIKEIDLTYGIAKVIAKKIGTSPQYVRNVHFKNKQGHNFHGIKAKKILRLIEKYHLHKQVI